MANGKIVADGPTNSVLSSDRAIELCSLSYPQMTQAARALKHRFPQVTERLTSLAEMEETIMSILGGRRR